MRYPKESKQVIEKVNKAIEQRKLMASGVFWEINCSEEFKKLPSEKRCYYEGTKLLCKWDDLRMAVFPGSDHTYACVCGNVCAIRRRRK